MIDSLWTQDHFDYFIGNYSAKNRNNIESLGAFRSLSCLKNKAVIHRQAMIAHAFAPSHNVPCSFLPYTLAMALLCISCLTKTTPEVSEFTIHGKLGGPNQFAQLLVLPIHSEWIFNNIVNKKFIYASIKWCNGKED